MESELGGPVVVVRDLHKRYGDQVAVDGLSFDVEAGEVYGLLGPNGAGKTTTVECLEGLRRPDDGTVEILGTRQEPGTRSLQERLGIQLQETELLPNLTVRETLNLFSAFFERPRPVDELVGLVGLEEKEHARYSTLSGGQKKRLDLALAVINDPDVIFLDEPTTGLDPQARRGVWDVVSDLRGRGRAIVLTTHYMEEAQRLCDRVGIIDHGRMIVEGSPRELLSDHFSEVTVEFDLPPGWHSGQLDGLPGVVRAASEGGGVSLSTTSVPETVGGLLDLARAGGLELGGLTVRNPTLEDLFLRLTGRAPRTQTEAGR